MDPVDLILLVGIRLLLLETKRLRLPLFLPQLQLPLLRPRRIRFQVLFRVMA